MTHGHQALSEKEKETLRLLVNGYDAKSMARHLGLSVHTINERLRDARRKMAVSSSREAARQLRDVERQNTETNVDRLLGDATPRDAMRLPSNQTGQRGTLRRSGWIAGGIVMSFSFAILAYAALSGGATTAGPESTTVSVEADAAAAARQWLGLVDAGNWNESWQATAQSFRSANTVVNWETASQSVRVPLGAVRVRELLDNLDVPTPPVGNRVIRFRTSFANKPEATETLALVLEGGSWKVVGYYID